MQPHTTTKPNGAPPPAHDRAPAAARAPNTSITRPPCHEAAPQHVNTHDDPMALDIDSLLELELQHTEDMEHHMDLNPPELEHHLPDVMEGGTPRVHHPPPLQAPPHKNGRTSTPSTSPT